MTASRNLVLARKLISLANDLMGMEPSALDGKTKKAATDMINKIMDPPSGIFRDEYWQGVTQVKKNLEKAGIFFIQTSAEYKRNSKGVDVSKEWKLEFPFKDNTGKSVTVYGVIIASGAGSADDPLSSYDVVAYAS